jgi:hypothetical protein
VQKSGLFTLIIGFSGLIDTTISLLKIVLQPESPIASSVMIFFPTVEYDIVFIGLLLPGVMLAPSPKSQRKLVKLLELFVKVKDLLFTIFLIGFIKRNRRVMKL